VAAAVALRTIGLYEERDIVGHVRDIAPHFQERLHGFTDHPMIGTVTGVGLMGGIEYIADKAARTHFEPAGKVAAKLTEFAELHGLIARPMFERTVFAPPLIITHDEIDEMFDRYTKALDDTWVWVQAGGLEADGDGA
jgi:4-aminobutyrate--pyruvate transaminase